MILKIHLKILVSITFDIGHHGKGNLHSYADWNIIKDRYLLNPHKVFTAQAGGAGYQEILHRYSNHLDPYDVKLEF